LLQLLGHPTSDGAEAVTQHGGCAKPEGSLSPEIYIRGICKGHQNRPDSRQRAYKSTTSYDGEDRPTSTSIVGTQDPTERAFQMHDDTEIDQDYSRVLFSPIMASAMKSAGKCVMDMESIKLLE